jgi:ATP-binding cassette subfamily B protein
MSEPLHADEDQLFDLLIQARGRKRSLRKLPKVLGQAVKTVRAAAGWLVWVGIAAQVVSALLSVVVIFLAERVLRSLTDQAPGSHHVDVPAFLGLVGATLASSLISTFAQQLQRLVSDRVERSTWEHVLGVAEAVELARYESPAFFDHLRRLEANALIRPYSVTMGLANLVGAAVGSAALAATLLRVEPPLLPVLVIGAVPLLLIARRTARLEFDLAVDTAPMNRERRYLREVLIGRAEAKELRAFEAFGVLRRRYDELYDSWHDRLRRLVRSRTALGLVGGGATSAVTLLSVALLFFLIAQGDTSLAAAGAALLAVRLLSSQIQQLTSSIGDLFESSLFLEDLDQFFAYRPPPPSSPLPPPPDLKTLRLSGVSFTYPETQQPAVRDVDIEVRQGEVVALVGENGSGKTTVSKLMGQLYEPGAGEILWNGERAADYDPIGRRAQISVTFQDFVKFALSARNNIGLGAGRLDAPPEEIVDAARRAGADEFLQRLPNGYETFLGKEFSGGSDLSMGQWQRVAIARAFFRQARLVILDEPTAALDPRSEYALFERVRTLFTDRAVVLVTHRLSSVRSADRIYVLHGGQVVETGRHEELIALDGLYAELFTLQASAFTDDISRRRRLGAIRPLVAPSKQARARRDR